MTGVSWRIVLTALLVVACGHSPTSNPRPDLEGHLLLSYEAVPSTVVESFRGSELEAESYAKRDDFTSIVHDEIVVELLQAFELESVVVEFTPGGFELSTNPSVQMSVPVSDVPSGRLQQLAAAIGYVLRQYSVLITDFSVEEGAGNAGLMTLRFPEDGFDEEVTQRFFEHAADVDPRLGCGYTAFRASMLFLNVGSETMAPCATVSDEEYLAFLDAAVKEWPGPVDVVDRASAAVNAEFIENDWSTTEDGSDYKRVIEDLDPALEALLDGLQAKHVSLVDAALD